MLEAQQRIIGGDPDRAVFPVSIRVDAAPIQGRKLLASMIAREAAAAALSRATGARLSAYCRQAAKASAKARSPGVPFSTARMARRLLL